MSCDAVIFSQKSPSTVFSLPISAAIRLATGPQALIHMEVTRPVRVDPKRHARETVSKRNIHTHIHLLRYIKAQNCFPFRPIKSLGLRARAAAESESFGNTSPAARVDRIN